MEPEPAFLIGMMFGALLLWAVQTMMHSRRERKRVRAEQVALAAPGGERRARELEALHERLAVLERIATDPSERTAAEIEKLR